MSTASPSLDSIIEAAIRRLGTHASASEIELEAIRMLERRSPSAPSLPSPTFCLSVSVASCSSRRSATQFSKVYDHLRLTIDAFRWDVAEALNAKLQHGDSSPLELHVRHSAHLFDGHSAKEVLSVATALANLASDTGIERVYGPFLDLSHSGNLSMVEIIPDLLTVHPAIHPVIQIGTREQGLDPHTLGALSLALSIRGQHRPSDEAGSSGATVVVNGCDQRAFGHRVHSDEVLFSMAARTPKHGGSSYSVRPHSESLGTHPDSLEIATRVAQIGAVAGRNWRFAPTTPGRPPHCGSPQTQLDQPRRASDNTPISCDSLTITDILETELIRQLGAWNDAGMTGWSEVAFPVR